MKVSIFLILTIIAFFACKSAQNVQTAGIEAIENIVSENNDMDGKVYMLEEVDEPPLFQSDDISHSLQKVQNYVNQHFPIPKTTWQPGCPNGRIVIQTIIDENGKTTDFTVLRSEFVGDCQDINEIVIKILENMPKWIPAKINGKPVKCIFFIPLVFIWIEM